MKKTALLFAALSIGLMGCRRDSPARKILDGAPAGSTITVLPIDAIQGLHQMENYMLSILVAITKRTSTFAPAYPEVTGGPTYQFNSAGSHYGFATYSFTYYDGPGGTGSVIDPLALQSSTATIASAKIDVTSSGIPFNGSGTFFLDLAVKGDVNSNMVLTGAYTMTATTYTVTMTLAAPGGNATFTGLSSGIFQLSGSGPGGPISGSFSVNTSHEYNGTLNWDGNNGEIHLKENAQALLLLNNERYFFE
jgi:hypothetical protein